MKALWTEQSIELDQSLAMYVKLGGRAKAHGVREGLADVIKIYYGEEHRECCLWP